MKAVMEDNNSEWHERIICNIFFFIFLFYVENNDGPSETELRTHHKKTLDSFFPVLAENNWVFKMSQTV